MTEPHDWPPEQSAEGALRPWHATAAGYLAVLFEDPPKPSEPCAASENRGCGDDLRLYDGEETLRIASRLQQERSRLAKAINEVVVDRALRECWLANARAGGSLLWIYAPRGLRQVRHPDGAGEAGLRL
ncbi:MAG TPA: hypothetical protein VFN05_03550 [Actinomycetes bacterium]|nr:hypothetical protein [Actinomycetes bacterium]